MPDQTLDILIRTRAELAGAEAAIAAQEKLIGRAKALGNTTDVARLTAEMNRMKESVAAAAVHTGGLRDLLSNLPLVGRLLGSVSGPGAIASAAVGVGGAGIAAASRKENIRARLSAFGLPTEEDFDAVRNIAKITGNDLAQSAENYIRATNGMAGELRRYGLELEEGISKTERLRRIQQFAAEKGADVLAAKSGTLSGKLEENHRAANRITEAFGEMILKTGTLQGVLDLTKAALDVVSFGFGAGKDEAEGMADKLDDVATNGGEAKTSLNKLVEQFSETAGAWDAEIARANALREALAEIAKERIKAGEAKGEIPPEESKAAQARIDIDLQQQRLDDQERAEIEKQKAARQLQTELSRRHQALMDEEAALRGPGGTRLTRAEINELEQLERRAPGPQGPLEAGVIKPLSAEERRRMVALRAQFDASATYAGVQRSRGFLDENKTRLDEIASGLTTARKQLDDSSAARDAIGARREALGISRGTVGIIEEKERRAAAEKRAGEYFKTYQDYNSGKVSPEAFDYAVKKIDPRAYEQMLRSLGNIVDQLTRMYGEQYRKYFELEQKLGRLEKTQRNASGRTP